MKHLFYISLSLLLAFPVFADDDDDEMAEVVEKVEEVNNLRESLVKAVPESPTGDTFKAVCAPVGKKAKAIAKEEGWKFKQVSHKYRNPNNKAQGLEVEAIEKMQKDPSLMGYWIEKGNERHYFRRITVRKDCLACHGPKNQRPEFVTKKYPKDKAYGFKQGDLRGLYHVWYNK